MAKIKASKIERQLDFYESAWKKALQQPRKELGTFLSRNLRPENKKFLQFLKNQGVKKGRLLDLGCGRGIAAKYFAEHGLAVTGIDYSRNAIKLARSATRALKNTKFVIGDVLKLPWPKNSFDIINDSGCFHHFRLKQREKYLTNIRKMLIPGGYYKLYCFSRETKCYQGYFQGQKKPWTLFEGQHYTHFFTPAEIRRIFSPYFEILNIGQEVGFDKDRKFLLFFMRKKFN